MTTGKLKIAKLDEFIERELMTQLINASQRNEVAATISCGVGTCRGLLSEDCCTLHFRIFCSCRCRTQSFLWQLGIRADNDLEISSGFVRRLFARIVGNE